MFRVSSVPRPGRDVLADLIRPRRLQLERVYMIDDCTVSDRVGSVAQPINQPMSEGYVCSPILAYLVFSLIRDTPLLDMLTSWADLR